MIKSLEITNFQSHKNTRLDFDKGVNVIAGSTNSGKTAIIRSLLWVLTNKPNGTSICSNWNVDEKGNIVKPFSAKIENDKGTVERVRSKSFNGYLVDGKKLGAIKMDVPQDVKEVLNLDDTNIQKQMDSPFLLSMSGPDATKLLNKIVKLDCIDTVLTKSNAEKRDLNAMIKVADNDLKKAANKVEELSWAPQASELLEEITIEEGKIFDVQNEKESLEHQTNDFILKESQLFDFTDVDKLTKELDSANEEQTATLMEMQALQLEVERLSQMKVNDFSKVDTFATRLEKLFKDGEESVAEKNTLFREIQYLQAYERQLQDFSGVDIVMPALEAVNAKLKEFDVSEINLLKNQIKQLETFQNLLENQKKVIANLESQMPEICPYCGGALCNKH